MPKDTVKLRFKILPKKEVFEIWDMFLVKRIEIKNSKIEALKFIEHYSKYNSNRYYEKPNGYTYLKTPL